MKETKKQIQVREACVKFIENWLSHADCMSRAAAEEGVNIFLRGPARATVCPLGKVEKAIGRYRTIGTMSINVEDEGIMKSLSCDTNTPQSRISGVWWNVMVAETEDAAKVAADLRDQGVPSVALAELGEAAAPIRNVRSANANPLTAIMGAEAGSSRYQDDEFLIVFEPSSAPNAADGRWTNQVAQNQKFEGIEL